MRFIVYLSTPSGITVPWLGDDPAHQQYLLSALARYLGDRESEESALRSAFRLTDPDEHDYLTLAQSYWHFLLENQRHADAEKFLLDVYRTAPREQLEEIREMLDETFAERAAAPVRILFQAAWKR